MDTIRQQQVAKLVQQALSEVFQKEGFNLYGRALVSISGVRVTADLLIARVYLSVFNSDNNDAIFAHINRQRSALRHAVGIKIRNKVRRIPELEFFSDHSLDEVFRLEKLFEDLNKAPHSGGDNADKES